MRIQELLELVASTMSEWFPDDMASEKARWTATSRIASFSLSTLLVLFYRR